jgi:hypothetical protein
MATWWQIHEIYVFQWVFHLYRAGPGSQNGFHHTSRGHAAARGPTNEPLGGPLGILTVGFGHVGGHGGVTAFEMRAWMASHPFTLMEYFNDVLGQSDIELMAHQGVRDRVIMPWLGDRASQTRSVWSPVVF